MKYQDATKWVFIKITKCVMFDNIFHFVLSEPYDKGVLYVHGTWLLFLHFYFMNFQQCLWCNPLIESLFLIPIENIVHSRSSEVEHDCSTQLADSIVKKLSKYLLTPKICNVNASNLHCRSIRVNSPLVPLGLWEIFYFFIFWSKLSLYNIPSPKAVAFKVLFKLKMADNGVCPKTQSSDIYSWWQLPCCCDLVGWCCILCIN